MQVSSVINLSYLRVNNPYENTALKNSNESSEEKDSKESQQTEELTSAEKVQITKLQASDQAVRRHESAHILVGGNLITSGANFAYQQGPDRKLYATSGEVGIDTSGGRTPTETISKMQRVRAAALAPSDPSSTDYQVASTATMLQMKARLELGQIKTEALLEKSAHEYANNDTMETKFSMYA